MSKLGFKPEVIKTFGVAGKTRNGVNEFNDILGYYASTDVEEYFAEAFAMFIGPDREKLGEVTTKMMNKFVDDVKKKIGRDPFVTSETHILNESSFDRNINKLRKSLICQKHEKMVIVNNKGIVVSEICGDSGSVHFDDDVAKSIKNNYITHNHPTYVPTGSRWFGYSLSSEDVFEAVRCDARGIIAETQNYRYSIQRPNNGWNVDANTLKKRYNEIYEDLKIKYRSSIKYHDASILLQHFVMKQLSKEFGLNYIYERL